MKHIAKLVSIVLVLAICIGFAPMPTHAATNEGETVDYVLVVDVSGSTDYSDRGRICLEACRMFVNIMPFENARVGVIAVGNADSKNAFVYSGKYDVTMDAYLVHEVAALQGASDLAEKEALKDQIGCIEDMAKDARDHFDDSATPLGMATLAAIELLEGSGAVDGNACIVMMTDGRLSSNINYFSDRELVNTAISAASGHDWPIYSIELNDDGKNDETAGQEWKARDILTRLAAGTGATFEDQDGDGQEEAGTIEVNDLADVRMAFLQILARFNGGKTGVVRTDANGVAEFEVTIPELTSEATVLVTGDNLKKVVLLDDLGKELYTAEKNEESGDIVSMVENQHICVKWICPPEEKIIVRVFGDKNAEIGTYFCTMSDMDLTLATDADLTKKVNKQSNVEFGAFFTYGSRELRNSKFYEAAVATLRIINNETGKVEASVPMSSGKDGYAVEVSVVDLGNGSFTAQVELSHERFDGGIKRSNVLTFATENILSEQIKDTIPPVTAFVNRVFDTINIDEFVKNLDRDSLTYRLECVSNPNVSFKYDFDEKENTLTIHSGLVPGAYELVLYVKDPDIAREHEIKLTATVEDRPVVSIEEELYLISDSNFFFELFGIKEDSTRTVSDMYYDPDGFAIAFENCVSDNEDAAQIIHEDGKWIVRGVKNGNATISVTMSDGILNADGELVYTTRELRVKVVGGWSVFWSQYKIYIIIIVLVILAIIAALLIRKAKKGLKGQWTVSIASKDGRAYRTEYPIDLSQYNNEKNLSLDKLMEEAIEPALRILRTHDVTANALRNAISYFRENNCLEDVKLYGTSKSFGFVVSLSKKSTRCEIDADEKSLKPGHKKEVQNAIDIKFQEATNYLSIRMERYAEDDE